MQKNTADHGHAGRFWVPPQSGIAAVEFAATKLDQPLAVSVPAAAKLAGVSRSTLYAEMAAGRLAFAKIGKRRLIPTEALLDWLRAATKEAA